MGQKPHFRWTDQGLSGPTMTQIFKEDAWWDGQAQWRLLSMTRLTGISQCRTSHHATQHGEICATTQRHLFLDFTGTHVSDSTWMSSQHVTLTTWGWDSTDLSSLCAAAQYNECSFVLSNTQSFFCSLRPQCTGFSTSSSSNYFNFNAKDFPMAPEKLKHLACGWMWQDINSWTDSHRFIPKVQELHGDNERAGSPIWRRIESSYLWNSEVNNNLVKSWTWRPKIMTQQCGLSRTRALRIELATGKHRLLWDSFQHFKLTYQSWSIEICTNLIKFAPYHSYFSFKRFFLYLLLRCFSCSPGRKLSKLSHLGVEPEGPAAVLFQRPICWSPFGQPPELGATDIFCDFWTSIWWSCLAINGWITWWTSMTLTGWIWWVNCFTSSDPHRDIILKHIRHKFWHSFCPSVSRFHQNYPLFLVPSPGSGSSSDHCDLSSQTDSNWLSLCLVQHNFRRPGVSRRLGVWRRLGPWKLRFERYKTIWLR